jgi:cytochrome c-type biogenesis protein CcmH
MIWFALAILAAVVLGPLAFTLRRTATTRGRREAAIALHRAQLAELDRDLAEGRIAESEHAAAALEVQRRLLAVAATTEAAPGRTSSVPIVAALVAVPVVAFVLYLVGGHPDLPATPLAARIAAAEQRDREEARLIEQLRARLAQIDPHSDRGREGYILLGNVEAQLGRMAEAAKAWGTALETRFDPTLAVETAEALTESEGRVTDGAAALFRRALAEAPQNAPWRPMAEKRLAEAK